MTDEISRSYGLIPTETPLSNWPAETIKFLKGDEAREIKEMGEQLIQKYRKDLLPYKIAYIFKQKASKSNNSVILGQAKSESDMQKVLHGYEAVVIIGFDTWKELTIDGKYRLVYHELSHFEIDEKGSLKTRTHAVEEFPEVIQLFGPGNDAQIDFINAYQKFSANFTHRSLLKDRE